MSQFHGCTHCGLLEEATLISKNSLEQCWHLSLLWMSRISSGASRDLWEAEHGAMSQGTCYAESSCFGVGWGWVLECVGTPAPVHMWKSEDKLLESLISFHPVGAGDRTQISRLARKAPLHTEPPCRLAMRILVVDGSETVVPGECPHFLAGNALSLPVCSLLDCCRNAMKRFCVRGSRWDSGGSGEEGWLRCIIYAYERHLRETSKQ